MKKNTPLHKGKNFFHKQKSFNNQNPKYNIYIPKIAITIPNIYFNTILKTPYFFVLINFLIVPTDVPATIIKKLYPIEYINNKTIPHAKLPLLATSASSTTSTGVAHGEENIPPKIPAITAPI